MLRRHAAVVRATHVVLAALSIIAGCGGSSGDDDSQGTCLDSLPATCDESFPPQFDLIYKNILVQSCGSSSTGTSCHYGPTDDLAKKGLVLSDPDVAYNHLLGKNGERARVIPGNPECSILEERLESTDPKFRMPVGRDALPAGDRCAIHKWIEQGATR